ncbi:MAG: hypothetical protein AB1798_20455 [Spirochaetota bacterium]
MMKKTIILLMLLFTAAILSARSQFRLAGDVGIDFTERPSLADVKMSLDQGSDIFGGFHWEVITHSNVGFGMHHLVKFNRITVESGGPASDWWLDWNGDMFISYHILGGGNLIDPFFEIGYGCAGRVDIAELHNDSRDEDWEKGECHYYLDEEPSEYNEHGRLTNLSLFPYIGGGLALDLNGLIIAAKFSWRPFINPIPAVQFQDYPLKNFQVLLSVGFAFGGHNNRRK